MIPSFDFRKTESFFLFSHALFVAAESLLYGLVLAGTGGRKTQYATIALSFLFASLYASRDERSLMTISALACTLLADFFLVLTSPDTYGKIMAMQAFSFVQLFYFVRVLLDIQSEKKVLFHLAARALFLVLAEGIALRILRERADHLSLLSVFYYANLVGNLLFSLPRIKKSTLLFFGLFFFLCCDTMVGLGEGIGRYLDLSADSFLYRLASSGFNYVWAFYIPAQALLAMSVSALFSPFLLAEKLPLPKNAS